MTGFLRVVAADGELRERPTEQPEAEILSEALVAVRRAARCRCLRPVAQDALDAVSSLLARHVEGLKEDA